MSAIQNAVVSMFKAIWGLLSSPESEPHLEDFNAAQNVIAKLGSKIEAVEDLVLTQTEQAGATEEKKQARESLTTLAIQIVGAILQYAHHKGDKRLEKRAGISATALGKAKDSRLVALCRSIHKLAGPLTQALEPSKITAEKIASLKTQTDDYKKSYTQPRQAIASGKGATLRLPVELRETSSILRNELDPLMVQFKTTHPEFYARYKAARRIVKPAVNPARQKKKAKGTTPSVTVPKAA